MTSVTDSDDWAAYLTPDGALRRLGLVCLGSGWQSGELAPLRNRVLNCHAAVLVERGEGWLEVTGQPRIPIRAPMVFWLVPGVRHSYSPSSAGWSERWALFDGAAATVYENLGLFDRARPAVPVADPGPLTAVFAELRRTLEDEDPLREVGAAALVHRLIVAAARSEDAREARRSPALTRLRATALEPVSVAVHARAMGMSVRQLREVVHREAGCTPMQFLVRTRLNAAKSLLAGTDLPVTRVAARVGYDDPAYFSRLFTRNVGVAPSHFRRQFDRGAQGRNGH